MVTLHNTKKDLTAIIDTVGGMSFLECSRILKRFVTRKTNVNALIAELDGSLVERIENAIDTKKYPLQFFDIGHIALLFNYANNQHIEPNYATLDSIPSLIRKVTEYNEKNYGKCRLYQLCTDEHKEEVKGILLSEGYTLVG